MFCPDPSLNRLIGALRLRRGMSCLDVGTGSGPVARLAAARGATVVGLDVRRGEAEVSRPPWRHNLFSCSGDTLELPLRTGSFNAVASRYALHHVSVPERAMEEIGRVLAPEGLAGILDFVSPSRGEAGDFLHTAHDIRDGEGEVRYPDARRWRELFQEGGLLLVRVEARLVPCDVETWIRHGDGDEETLSQLKEHFENAPRAVRRALSMEPLAGAPRRFAAIELLMVGLKV